LAIVNRFEDLAAWQKARALSRAVFESSSRGTFQRDNSLGDQLNKSTAAVASKIAEGYDRGNLTEFSRFLVTAKGLCAETRSHLYVALDRHHLTEGEFAVLQEQAEGVAQAITNLLSTIRRQVLSAALPATDPNP
jgi:four helix bundle protein